MKYTALSEHLHQLREKLTRGAKPPGYRMSAMDIWLCALKSDLNNISDIRVLIDILPPGFEGLFVRFRENDKEKVIIATGQNLSHARQEFVISKELMHCWSPPNSRVNSPDRAKALAEALSLSSPISAATFKDVQADRAAIMAAAEVILPHYILEKAIAEGISLDEIASRHNIDIEIAKEICPHYTLNARKNGHL